MTRGLSQPTACANTQAFPQTAPIVWAQFVTTHNNVGFARKNVQTISLIERGFERLGLGHHTRVSHLVRTELGRVRSRNLSP